MNSKLQEYFHCMVGTNAYLTPKNSQGFAPHYDDIEAFVDAVNEIDVGVARWAEDDACSGRQAASRVRGEVRFAAVGGDIGFHFNNAPGSITVNDGLAEQTAGDFNSGPGVEGARQHGQVM